MENLGSFVSGENGGHSGVGFVWISKIFVMQDAFLLEYYHLIEFTYYSFVIQPTPFSRDIFSFQPKVSFAIYSSQIYTTYTHSF